MATNANPASPTPWYLRLKTLIITAGALAAALASIVTLANLLSSKDENDVADIPSVTVIKSMMLSEFETEKLGGELSLKPAPDAAEQGAPVISLAQALVLEATHAPAGRTMEPTLPGTEMPRTVAPTPIPTPTPTPTVAPTPVREGLAVAMANRADLQGHSVRPSDVAVVRPVPMLNPEAGDPDDSGLGSSATMAPLSPDEEIDRLLDALAAVEGGDPATLNPRGYLVTVELFVKGYQGERLMLTYSMDPKPGGAVIPESWSAKNLAYYMTPTTQDDSGVADIWIPDLVSPGPHVVNVELWTVNEGVKIASGQSAPID